MWLTKNIQSEIFLKTLSAPNMIRLRESWGKLLLFLELSREGEKEKKLLLSFSVSFRCNPRDREEQREKRDIFATGFTTANRKREEEFEASILLSCREPRGSKRGFLLLLFSFSKSSMSCCPEKEAEEEKGAVREKQRKEKRRRLCVNRMKGSLLFIEMLNGWDQLEWNLIQRLGMHTWAVSWTCCVVGGESSKQWWLLKILGTTGAWICTL